jgi:hypothetical protein
MRTGEGSAARQAAAFLADDVVLIGGGERIVGRAQVAGRTTGQWPMTPVYYRATWSTPTVDDHTVKVEATPATRNRVFEIAPEVEQNHDPQRLGAALIIDVEQMDGMSAHGVTQVRRSL